MPHRYNPKALLLLCLLALMLIALRPVAAVASRAPAVADDSAPFRSEGADWFEGFNNNGPTLPGDDGPTNLIQAGWLFSNQSEPVGPTDWFDGSIGYLPPQEGSGYLAANFDSTDQRGTISNWAIMPEVEGMGEGDVLSIWTTSASTGKPDRLQVRYSPSGGTDTGSGAFDTGDFSTVLLDLDPVPNYNDPNADENGWLHHELALPGDGRVAFRYFVQDGGIWGNNSTYIGLDAVGLNVPPPPPPCVPPLPASGETVTWSANSFVEICTSVTIPAGGTVVVEPGVEILVHDGETLTVNGTLQGAGTAGNPIVFNGQYSFYTPPILVFGSAALDFITINGALVADSGSTITVSNCTINEGGAVYGAATFYSFQEPKFIEVEGCQVEGGTVFAADSTLLLRNSTFNGVGPNLFRGYTLMENVEVDSGQISLYRENAAQSLYIDNVEVRNFTQGGGLFVEQGNYFIGPNTVLQNNLYPVHVEGGLLPGSSVPLDRQPQQLPVRGRRRGLQRLENLGQFGAALRGGWGDAGGWHAGNQAGGHGQARAGRLARLPKLERGGAARRADHL